MTTPTARERLLAALRALKVAEYDPSHGAHTALIRNGALLALEAALQLTVSVYNAHRGSRAAVDVEQAIRDLIDEVQHV